MSKEKLSAAWCERIFLRIEQAHGGAAIGLFKDRQRLYDEWGVVLAGLSSEQIAGGLGLVKVLGNIPNAQQFRAMCWADAIFKHMEGFYGSLWTGRWGASVIRAKALWARELTDMTTADIVRGLTALRTKDLPPTLPEFIKMCDRILDPEAAFYEAQEQLAIRYSTGGDVWSDPVIFWAATRIGNDVQNSSYDKMEKRWVNALDAAARGVRSGAFSVIVPLYKADLAQLPAPGKGVISKEEARKNVLSMMDALAKKARVKEAGGSR